ncbi:MAG: DUF1015 domain-containing protein [Candidatus Binataceae bacterium]|nr:DUF1015 domain-containing protein [Candidatus Binataceae bacterium]
MIDPGIRIAPFRALTFACERAGPLADLIAPPYDLIDAARQAALYARSPHNIVRLELNRDADPYGSAAAALAEWRAGGILTRGARPAIFFYTQKFSIDDRPRVRTGLIARVRLDEFAAGKILPHERTFPKAREDRLRLLSATRLNVSPIFGLYPPGDAALNRLLAEVAARAPQIDVTDDLGIVNQVRAIEAPDELATIQRALAEVRVLIADGHHRYETALEYRRRRRAADGNPAAAMPYDFVMMTLVAFDDPGLMILPTHRIVRRIEPEAIAWFTSRAQAYFALSEVASIGALRRSLPTLSHGAFGYALKGDARPSLLMLNRLDAPAEELPGVPAAVRELDVSILHTLVFDRLLGIKPDEVRAGGNLEYTIDAPAALAEVAAGRADGAFIMNAPTVDDVAAVCAVGATMPEKSTYFQPKLLTGLVMNSLDDE